MLAANISNPPPESGYQQQWATLFLLLTAAENIDLAKVEAIVRAALPDWEFDTFVAYKTLVTVKGGMPTSGPWAGRNGMELPYVMSIKANARTVSRAAANTEVSVAQVPSSLIGVTLGVGGKVTLTGIATDLIRTTVRPRLDALGYRTSYMGFSQYGKPSVATLSVDKGLPLTPALPPQDAEKPPQESSTWLWWLVFGGAATTIYAYSRPRRGSGRGLVRSPAF